MSLEKAVHVFLVKVTPTSGKGLWALGGSYDGRGLALIKPSI
jgi:hypothetical protein